MENKVSDTSEIILGIVNQLKSGFNQYSLSENNVIDYVMRVMNLVEMNNKLSGFEKKAVVIEVINKLLDESPNLTPEAKTSLKLIVNVVVPNVIEAVVSATKGNTNINKLLSEKKCCFF
jgi:Ni,Fe-hydrogenase maturation factor